MRNNKKKGFTLVELLVVIAILAILATVSVVGYTSFIESATVSNDENIAAQLNQFLVAMKADSNGPFYGEEINEDNIWEVTQYILKDSGLEELDPQAGKYNYHFYFDLAEGKYVVLNDKEAIDDSILSVLINALAAEEKVYSEKPGNYFTKDCKYFLVDTKGSIAEFLTDVYNFNGGAAELAELYAEAQALTNSKGDETTAFADMLKETVFITDAGTIVVNTNDTHTMLVVSNKFSTGVIGSEKIGANGSVYMDANNPLITVDKDVVIRIPNNALVYGNSLHIATTGDATATIVLGNNAWKNFDANFTGTNVKLVMNGAEFEMKDTENVHKYVADETVGDHVATLGSMNPMGKVDVAIEELVDTKKLHTIGSTDFTNVGYIAWNQPSFTLVVANAEGKNDANKPVSSTVVKWSVKTNISNLISVDETTGEVTISNSQKLAEATDDSFVIRATSTSDESVYRDFEIKIVKLATVDVGVSGEYNPAWDADETVTLIYDGGDGKEYEIVVKGATYVNKINEIELDLDVSLVFDYDHDCADYSECCLHNQGTHSADANNDGFPDCYVCKHTLGQHDADNTETTNVNESCCVHNHVYVPENATGVQYYRCNICELTTPTENGVHYCYSQSSVNSDWKWDKCENGVDCAHGGADGSTHVYNKCCGHITTIASIKVAHDANCMVCNHQHGDACVDINCKHLAPTISGNKLTTNGACSSTDNATITVTVDHVTLEAFATVIVDTSNLPVVPNSLYADTQNIYVGNGNSIMVSDLFSLRDPTDTSAYTLKVFSAFNETNYNSASSGTPLPTSGAAFTVNNNSIDLSTEDGFDVELQFTGTSGSSKIIVAVFNGDVRASENIEINVVNGLNIWHYADMVKDSATITTGIVLHDDIAIVKKDGTAHTTNEITLKNMTFYGNLFKFDVSNGTNVGGIINLNNSRIQDTKIVGAVYTKFALSQNDDWSSPAVNVSGTSSIHNCYIANTRSPIRQNGGTLTLSDTVLFGGRYCNLDLVGGTLIIDGTVTTVQQPVIADNGTEVIGVGISAWFNTSGETIQFTEDADFIQYNFVDEDTKNSLPTLIYQSSIGDVSLVDMKEPFGKIFTEKNSDGSYKYGSYHFSKNSETYVNTGIVSLDKHLVGLTYPKKTDDKHLAGAEITITFTVKTQMVNESLTFKYDKSKFKEADNYDGNATDGQIVLTGLNWAPGTYTYKLITLKEMDYLGYDFDFIYTGNALNHLSITTDGDNNVLENYGTILYDYSFPDMFKLIEWKIADSFHSSSLHYDRIEIDVHSLTNDKQANKDLLDDYLEICESGEYLPGNYKMSYSEK